MKNKEINKMVDMQYIYSAMEILASAFDLCVNKLSIKPQNVIDIFFISGIYEYYDIKSPRYISGISGRELAILMLEKVDYKYKNVDFDYVNFSKSKEYWAMYMIAYYKYMTNKTFKNIFDFVCIDDIINMYSPLHEASFDKFIEEINEIEKEKRKCVNMSSKIKTWRLNKNMTQKELAEKTGIKLRTLQKYEINEKDIMKASYETVEVLKNVLGQDF